LLLPFRISDESLRRAAVFAAALGAFAVLSPVQAMSRHARHEVRLARHEAHFAARHAHHAVAAQKIAAQSHALASHNVVMAAYAFRGTRYVMGGTSRSGFDCSGFVRYILGHADGVALPRTAVEQFYHGTPIPVKDLQPGDLVFFKNTYKRGISHVGIYAGDGKFIHAANPHRGVQMDSLDSPYYQHHFAGARRVLPAQMRALAGWTPQQP
jgi:cell wall-associated NlpC family hydrolase